MVAAHPGIFHPQLVAKMGATLDRVSSGRFAMNVVNGWWPEEFNTYGNGGWLAEADHRYRRMNEFVQVVKGLWTEEELPRLLSLPQNLARPRGHHHNPVGQIDGLAGCLWVYRPTSPSCLAALGSAVSLPELSMSETISASEITAEGPRQRGTDHTATCSRCTRSTLIGSTSRRTLHPLSSALTLRCTHSLARPFVPRSRPDVAARYCEAEERSCESRLTASPTEAIEVRLNESTQRLTG
jgi:Luciferase-like monooxygenase